MALRDFFSLSEIIQLPPVEPVSSAHQQSASDLSDLDSSFTEQAEAEVPPVLQALAMEMEQSRRSLQVLLLKNPCAQHLLAAQLHQSLSNGQDADGAIEQKLSDRYIVQNNLLVQVEKLQIDDLTENEQCLTLLDSFRFLPVQLMQIAQQLLKSMADNHVTDYHYCQQVQKTSLTLQNLRQKMINSNAGLVGFVVYKHKPSTIGFEDLIQEGTIGLMKAVDRFDPYRGIRFSTYAIFWIKQAVSRLIIKQEKIVRLPVALAEKAVIVFEIMRISYQELNRWPTQAEIQGRCNLSAEEIKTISSYYQSTHSLDSSLSEDYDDLSLLDTLKQQQFELPLNDLINKDLSQHLATIIAGLSDKEAAIINMRFGLKNHTEMTLQAVAEQLDITRERVRQIQNKALNKIKQQFGCDLLPFLEANDS